ncbi:DUF2782 domain-containing protein [Pseudomonas sp. LS-2]|jgi:hypothetical protein|uniref:DUF2782 domain-containing protein n=1 Tax=Pseudomonas sp. LS-2 TaxID=2315859 RepID=UPI000E729F92|nr:DUF2782 domain-containing protein [Pseudomonas sp. LS-2]RJX76518.1 DUF2782 domain-containing protein [Pseudomonas sp. LS-2]
MRTLNRLLLVSLTAACPLMVAAAEDEAPSPEPDVTIRKDGDNFIQEYKANGFVYAVKITPKYGKPYYLVRADGTSGQFIRSDQPDMLIPQWVLFSW